MNTVLLCWLFAIPVLGLMTGNRCMTPMAVLCWFAAAGRMPIHQTWAFWTTLPVTAIVFTVLAFGELIGDKLPQTPNRTAIFPLLARLTFGGLVGAIAATSLHKSALEGILLGAMGALAGSFLGFRVRQHLVKVMGIPDLRVALLEDLITIGLSFTAMSIITG
jgi:uncharacterized membrane protein